MSGDKSKKGTPKKTEGEAPAKVVEKKPAAAAPAEKKVAAVAEKKTDSPKKAPAEKKVAAEAKTDSPKKSAPAEKKAAAPAKESPKAAAPAKTEKAAAPAKGKAAPAKESAPATLSVRAPKAAPIVIKGVKRVFKKKAANSKLVTVPGPQLPALPASLALKRKRTEERVAKQKADMDALRKKRRLDRSKFLNRARGYENEYNRMEREVITSRREAKRGGNFYLEAEPKFALVVRIRGTMGLAPKPRKILQLLRLRQINNAVFVKLSKPMLNMLKIVDPYITWGMPSLGSLKKLIYKRAHLRIKGARIPLSDNALIAKNVGAKGIECVEDLIHELYTVGPKFQRVNNFLWPFKLNPPRGGWKLTLKHVNEGGDFGYRGAGINDVVRRMI